MNCFFSSFFSGKYSFDVAFSNNDSNVKETNIVNKLLFCTFRSANKIIESQNYCRSVAWWVSISSTCERIAIIVIYFCSGNKFANN